VCTLLCPCVTVGASFSLSNPSTLCNDCLDVGAPSSPFMTLFVMVWSEVLSPACPSALCRSFRTVPRDSEIPLRPSGLNFNFFRSFSLGLLRVHVVLGQLRAGFAADSAPPASPCSASHEMPSSTRDGTLGLVPWTGSTNHAVSPKRLTKHRSIFCSYPPRIRGLEKNVDWV
jgi:hypothetical protein